MRLCTTNNNKQNYNYKCYHHITLAAYCQVLNSERYSLVPRPMPFFGCTKNRFSVLKVTKSWAGAWEYYNIIKHFKHMTGTAHSLGPEVHSLN